MDNHEEITFQKLKKEGKIYGALEKSAFRLFSVKRIDQEIISYFQSIEDITCELSDTMDRLGYRIGRCIIPSSEIHPLRSDYKAVGTAVTQRSCPEQIRKDTLQGKMPNRMSTRDVPFFAEKGDVWVVEAKGCMFSHFGEIAAKMQKEHGLAGTILDGYLRDGETIKATNYPFWCKGQTPYSGMGRIETVEVNGPVTIGDIQIRPGDLVAADANGICAIPAELVPEVYEEMKNRK